MHYRDGHEPSSHTKHIERVLSTDLQRREDKGGAALAQELEEEIMRRGWPVGQSLGSEAQLMERFGVGRSVLREAVGLLEQHSVARARRGPGGGLIVSEPDVGSLARTVGLYLHYLGVSASDIRQLRVVMEGAATELAAVNLLPEQLEHIEQLALRERTMDEDELQLHAGEFHLAIAEASHNPAIQLLHSLINKFSVMLIRVEPSEHRVLAPIICSDHAAIMDALRARDGMLARRRMVDHIIGLRDYERERDIIASARQPAPNESDQDLDEQ